jgi:hypothetical protein
MRCALYRKLEDSDASLEQRVAEAIAEGIVGNRRDLKPEDQPRAESLLPSGYAYSPRFGASIWREQDGGSYIAKIEWLDDDDSGLLAEWRDACSSYPRAEAVPIKGWGNDSLLVNDAEGTTLSCKVAVTTDSVGVE